MSYTNPIFHLRGDSLNGYVSQSGKTPAQLLSDVGTSAVVSSVSADTGVFGGFVLTKASATKVRALTYPGFNNVSGNAGFSMLMRIVPRFTGAPAFENGLYFSEGVAPGGSSNGRSIGIDTSGKLHVVLRDKYGTNYFNGLTTAGYTSFVSGTAVDILAVWDGTTAALTFYVNGVSIGTLTPGAGAPAMDANLLTGLNIGMCSTGVLGNYDINEFAIWNSALSGADITALSARAAWIASTPFDGTSYVDPGIANVKIGASYTFAGVVLTGTYDGSDRWSDPGISNVKIGTAYKANSVTNNMTGTYNGSDRWSDPGVTNVKIGTAYKANSVTNNMTGTYDGSDRWSDPGVSNVRLGTAYKANSVTNNETGTAAIPAASDVRLGVSVGSGSGTCVVPVTTDVKHGVAVDVAGVGSYRGADLWSDPGLHNVATGVIYLANGVTMTGDMDEPNESNVKIGVIYDNGSKTGTYTGADRWSDPGVGNVRAGTTYLANAIAKIGTLETISYASNETGVIGPDTLPPVESGKIKITQGDGMALQLVLQLDGVSAPIDLTGATFETQIPSNSNGVIVIPNSDHAVLSAGRIQVAIASDVSANFRLGANQSIVTTVTHGSVIKSFQGVGILTVLPNTPL